MQICVRDHVEVHPQKKKEARDAIRWILSDNPAKIFHNYT